MCLQIFIGLFPLIGAGTSLIIQLEETTTTRLRPFEFSSPKENADVKSYRVVEEDKKEVDKEIGDSAAPRNAHNGPLDSGLNVVRNGVKKIYHAIPIRINENLRRYISDDTVEDTVSERINHVENKVEALSQELDNLETVAGIYFVARIFSGLLFNFVVL